MKKSETPFIIPIFIPQQGCRHQCVFCNQAAITGHPTRWPSINKLRLEAEKYLGYNNRHRPSVIAFYGGNFLGLPQEKSNDLLTLADDFICKGKIQSIRFSTRPDTVSEEKLQALEKFSVTEIELGVQSMDDQVLNNCRRGHCALDTRNAVKLLKEWNCKIGLQLMIGLPGQSEKSAFDTAKQVAELAPDFVRIYPAVVFNQSILANWYRQGKYRPLSLKEAVYQAKNIYLHFKKYDIPVIRMGLQSSREFADKNTVLAGPYHPAFGHLVLSEIFMDTMCGFFKNTSAGSGQLKIAANPKCISQVRGIGNQNIRKLENDFKFDEIRIVSDPKLPRQGLSINHKWIDMPFCLRETQKV